MGNILVNEINNCESLFFLNTADKDGTLEIEITSAYKAVTDKNILDEESNIVLKSILENSAQISPDYRTVFRIIFKNSAAYQVTNESFTYFDSTAEGEQGRFFRKFNKSAYLDYIANTTFAVAVTENLSHYQICTAEKIVDVIASDEPKIEKVKFGW